MGWFRSDRGEFKQSIIEQIRNSIEFSSREKLNLVVGFAKIDFRFCCEAFKNTNVN
jgi:hypothetical protein